MEFSQNYDHFPLSGAGKQLQSESGQICDQSPWLKNNLNWIKLNWGTWLSNIRRMNEFEA